MFATNPYEAVRQIYDYIAQDGDHDLVCLRFKDRGQQFASNMGYPDCEQAVRGLAGQVTDRNAYAESMPSATATPVSGDSVRISSCEDSFQHGIQGGPPLGAFTVEKIPESKGEQWIIAGHENETRQCVAQS